jgi:hypothetical protein
MNFNNSVRVAANNNARPKAARVKKKTVLKASTAIWREKSLPGVVQTKIKM